MLILLSRYHQSIIKRSHLAWMSAFPNHVSFRDFIFNLVSKPSPTSSNRAPVGIFNCRLIVNCFETSMSSNRIHHRRRDSKLQICNLQFLKFQIIKINRRFVVQSTNRNISLSRISSSDPVQISRGFRVCEYSQKSSSGFFRSLHHSTQGSFSELRSSRESSSGFFRKSAPFCASFNLETLRGLRFHSRSFEQLYLAWF